MGLSNATLLPQHHEVISLDVVPQRVNALNYRVSPITDAEIEEYLQAKTLNLKATLNKEEAFTGAGFVIIAFAIEFHDSEPFRLFASSGGEILT